MKYKIVVADDEYLIGYYVQRLPSGRKKIKLSQFLKPAL